MDFTTRSTQPGPAFRSGSVSEQAAGPEGGNEKKRSSSKLSKNKWYVWGSVVLLFCVVALVVSVTLLIAFQKNNNESKIVDNSKYQAVFLNSGQVYFGRLVAVNNSYFDLKNVYYLQTSSSSTSSTSTSNSNPSLVKLGCQQLHDPYDEMIINSSQVSFWENLQDGGQVVKAIDAFQKANPNGPNCSDQTSNASTQSAQTLGQGSDTAK
jgi:hypothetical protein